MTDQELRVGAKEQQAGGQPVELPAWYLAGSEEAFKPLSKAEALGKSEGIPFAGMNLWVRFEGRPTGERYPGQRELVVIRFEEATLCPRKPTSLHGCSN